MSNLHELRDREGKLIQSLQEVQRERYETEIVEDAAYRELFHYLLYKFKQDPKLLDILVPDHESTTCSDKELCGTEPRFRTFRRHSYVVCIRCALLTWMKYPETVPESFRLEFRINLLDRENPDQITA